MHLSPRAFLKDSRPVDSVPLESPSLIRFTDRRTGAKYVGYMIDVDALSEDELFMIYADMKERFPDVPVFDSWLETVRIEGMPIREERVTSVAFDANLVV